MKRKVIMIVLMILILVMTVGASKLNLDLSESTFVIGDLGFVTMERNLFTVWYRLADLESIGVPAYERDIEYLGYRRILSDITSVNDPPSGYFEYVYEKIFIPYSEYSKARRTESIPDIAGFPGVGSKTLSRFYADLYFLEEAFLTVAREANLSNKYIAEEFINNLQPTFEDLGETLQELISEYPEKSSDYMDIQEHLDTLRTPEGLRLMIKVQYDVFDWLGIKRCILHC